MKGGKKGKDGKGKGKKDFKRNDWQKEKGKSTGNGKKDSKGKDVTCYNCGKASHMTKGCWTKTVQKLEDHSRMQFSPTSGRSIPSNTSSSLTSATAYADNQSKSRWSHFSRKISLQRNPISEVFDLTKPKDEPKLYVDRARVVWFLDSTSEVGSDETDPGRACQMEWARFPWTCKTILKAVKVFIESALSKADQSSWDLT